MYNLIRADLFKMRKSMAIKVLFGITTVSAVAMAVIAYLIPQGKIATSMTGIGFMFSDINMISILGAVIAGVFICGDFDNKTIHDAIACGSSRGAVIISKAIVFFFAIAFILLPYAVTTGIALSTGSKFSMGSVAVGFLHLLTLESGKAFSASEIWKLLAVMLTLVIVYTAQLSICVPLALVLKKAVLVVAIYYGFTILCANLMGLRGSSPVFDRISACTPYGGNYTFVTLDTGTGGIFKAISVSMIFIIELLAESVAFFEENNLTVHIEEATPVFVSADREMTVRIVQNLIRNCLAHSGGDVTVRVWGAEKGVISFKNSLKNTSEIDVERLFDRFYTADKSRNKSTGLGLSIVWLLAEKMSGSASVALQNGLLDIQVRLPLQLHSI